MKGRLPSIEEELGGAAAAETVAAMAGRIRAATGVLVTSHVHPDGDALGSELAILHGLRRLGKTVRVVNDHPPPEKYRFLDPGGAIEVLAAKPGPGSYPGIDIGILLDTSEPQRTGRLEERFFAADLERLCLDHHPGPPSPRFALHWVAPAAPATGTLAMRLLDALGVEIEREIAVPLFAAIATDTGWFRFSNTTPLTLRDAARLLEAGVAPEPLHRRIYEDSSAARLSLLGHFLAGLQVEMGGRFVWSALDRATLERSGVPYEELDGFSEELKAVRGDGISATLVELSAGAFKVSLRSRGEVAVDAIARAFGGGGHRKAAGYRSSGDLHSILAALRARLAEVLR